MSSIIIAFIIGAIVFFIIGYFVGYDASESSYYRRKLEKLDEERKYLINSLSFKSKK